MKVDVKETPEGPQVGACLCSLRLGLTLSIHPSHSPIGGRGRQRVGFASEVKAES
jgi:hypothetical protein